MNVEVLRAVANATAANSVHYVTAAEGKPLVDEGFITVDVNQRDPSDQNKVAAKITAAGATALAAHVTPAHKPNTAMFAVQTGGIELPKVSRGFKKGQGGGGRDAKYPFETMEVGQFIFVANSAVSKGDAVKTLGSAAGSANQRFAKELPTTKTVQRAKRGPDHKAIKGPDGKNEMETVTVHEKEFTKKFVVRPVKANVAYGAFTAPADGAVVAREK